MTAGQGSRSGGQGPAQGPVVRSQGSGEEPISPIPDSRSLIPGPRPRASVAAIAAPTALIAALLVAWELIVRVLNTPNWLLPAPTQVLRATWETQDVLWVHTQQSLLETWLGLGLALVAGLALALVIDLTPLLRRSLYPVLVASQTMPILAIAPLLIIWFGFGVLPKVIVVALVCFFPIAVNTADGLRSVDPDLISLLRSMGASRRQVLAKVRLPAALPLFFSGLKIAVTYSVTGAIIGEWVGASQGLGIFMLRSQHSYLTDRVFAAIMVTSLVSIAMFLVVMVIERTVLPWYYTSARSEQWEELTRTS
jgi:ABC-type nitrate/sulfonate/bicarbonate transport system permease component